MANDLPKGPLDLDEVKEPVFVLKFTGVAYEYDPWAVSKKLQTVIGGIGTTGLIDDQANAGLILILKSRVSRSVS